MKFIFRIFLTLVVASLLGSVAVGQPQSLGDAARQQRATKTTPAKKVFTDENLPVSSSGISVTGTPAAAESAAGKSEDEKDAKPVVAGEEQDKKAASAGEDKDKKAEAATEDKDKKTEAAGEDKDKKAEPAAEDKDKTTAADGDDKDKKTEAAAEDKDKDKKTGVGDDKDKKPAAATDDKDKKTAATGDDKDKTAAVGSDSKSDKAAPVEKAAEEQFRSRVDDQQKQISLLEREISVIQRESQIDNSPPWMGRDQGLSWSAEAKRKKTEEEVTAKQQALEAARQKLDEIREQARKAGLQETPAE